MLPTVQRQQRHQRRSIRRAASRPRIPAWKTKLPAIREQANSPESSQYSMTPPLLSPRDPSGPKLTPREAYRLSQSRADLSPASPGLLCGSDGSSTPPAEDESSFTGLFARSRRARGGPSDAHEFAAHDSPSLRMSQLSSAFSMFPQRRLEHIATKKESAKFLSNLEDPIKPVSMK